MERNRVLFILVLLVLLIMQPVERIIAQSSFNKESIEKLKELSDFTNWPGKEGPVRDGINLSKIEVQSLSDVVELPSKIPSFFPWEKDEEGILIKYNSQWQISSSNFLEITLTFGNNCEEAHECLIKRFFNSTIPFEGRIHKKDGPVVAGDISFDNGRYFIRNNIVVEFQGNGVIVEKIPNIAREVDNLLLMKQTASSANQFKPVIKQFGIENTYVEHGSYTKLVIDAHDSQGNALYYYWRMGDGGIEKDDLGNYYYYAQGDVGFNDKITLIVVSDRGYYSTAEIEVTIK